jgi:ABC-2 type transport system ATP-binding protein
MSIDSKNITHFYGRKKALDSVTFSVNKGELTGFLGPNGAGKSTLMKIIAGFLVPSSGEVFIQGSQLTPQNRSLRGMLGYLPENNPLYMDLYVKESLEITAGFYGLKNSRTRIAEMMEITGLRGEEHKKIGALSRGYRQRVGIAQALIHNPPVLILDEPTSGLDPNQLDEIRRLIRNISLDKTVILSSHIMQEIEAICSRVLIIHQGRMIADGPVDELKNRNFKKNRSFIAEFSGIADPQELKKINGVTNAMYENGLWFIEAIPEKDIRSDLFHFAVQQGLVLLTLQEKKQSLEYVFQQLTR